MSFFRSLKYYPEVLDYVRSIWLQDTYSPCFFMCWRLIIMAEINNILEIIPAYFPSSKLLKSNSFILIPSNINPAINTITAKIFFFNFVILKHSFVRIYYINMRKLKESTKEVLHFYLLMHSICFFISIHFAFNSFLVEH